MLDVSELTAALGGDDLEPDVDIITRFRTEDALQIPKEFTDIDLWENYVDDDLYNLDVKVQEWLAAIKWKKQRQGYYKTTSSLVFAWIFGRKATPADSGTGRILNRLLRYYCTKYAGKTTYHGKTVPNVYYFSKHATEHKRPYSLRLRLEMMNNGTANFDSVVAKAPDRGNKRTYGRSGHRLPRTENHGRDGGDDGEGTPDDDRRAGS